MYTMRGSWTKTYTYDYHYEIASYSWQSFLNTLEGIGVVLQKKFSLVF